ncbi:MAG TPA: IS1595 family transposase [Conexibacter sp.]|jgi:transposase|nr:IS1595 family transposase [Conexibacter sp.]
MARSRDSVDPSPSSESTFTYNQFLETFPDNEACLAYLKEQFYADGTECPKCGKASKFHRIKGRSAYSCQYCGYHAYPTAGTIFHKSSVSLQLWFFAVYLMSSTRCGISAKQLEREIGVTYKTAHRMFKMIRTLLSDEGEPPLSGDVEVDESGYGGKPRAYEKRNKLGKLRESFRPTMLAMVERRGRVRPRVIDGRTTPAIHSTVKEHVLPDSMLFTDEYRTYVKLGEQYRGHKRIKHIARVYVDGDTHTQTVEGFFGLFKNGVRGVYHSISGEYLQNYLDEYAFRYNRRHSRVPMFFAMLSRVQTTVPAGPATA